MNQPRKRRHHTVPRFYLARFADARKQLMRVELPGIKGHLMSIGNATVENDFYLVETNDGSPSDAVEDSLSELEGQAATALRQLIDERVWPIPEAVRRPIAAWAAIQYLRTPAARQAGNDIADAGLKLSIALGGRSQMRAALESVEARPVTEAEVDEMWALMNAFDDYKYEAHQNLHVHTMSQSFPGTAAGFFSRGWHVVRFTRKALITTDTPVVLMKGPGQGLGLPIGTASAGGVLVPLDRRMALIMGEPHTEDFPLSGSTSIAKALNQRLVWNARRAAFHHPEDDPLCGLELPQPRDTEVTFTDPQSFLPDASGEE
ncbi:DUF4238 domain-containing protein (plasmid) [Streptomyces sp. NBC_00053]|uniref:DUF4238 domain-containing protein n=1 Tax=unclassified Streptomyces TaxID=2593676 RepID=UPI000F5BDB85|nr:MULTISPECIES: DUF4238 domain-containing protein [unclassified Streptomyces]MCX4400029.1 DUF4238 domain-containing protein [Streptomyces sp. NBC_01767]MCX5505972.1 DUF4238 domain-containing protein [Streptomyces sp. NBC_00052]MCX5554029.1 DUF4238 domain-containing protein [Streptomyces sp. NBC_00051]MCX5554375.1 DUF4238 domain-containing protein [Streptomyces sp. NBC_00051]RPK56048.1 hypothetical protein EES42_41350 [Streptomyces sp. ADI95-17]